MTDYTQEILKIFINEIEAVNNFENESIIDILHGETLTPKQRENSNTFSYIKITDAFKIVLEEIAIEVNQEYRTLAITDKRLNYEFLEHLATEMRVYYHYFKLLNRFKRKDKQDTQPLKAYLNNLKTIKEFTLNLNLKDEVENEINFYTNIDTQFKNQVGFIHEIANLYNTKRISKNKSNKLEHFVKLKIQSIVP